MTLGPNEIDMSADFPSDLTVKVDDSQQKNQTTASNVDDSEGNGHELQQMTETLINCSIINTDDNNVRGDKDPISDSTIIAPALVSAKSTATQIADIMQLNGATRDSKVPAEMGICKDATDTDTEHLISQNENKSVPTDNTGAGTTTSVSVVSDAITATSISRSHQGSTTVTVTAGGITATVTTTAEDTSSPSSSTLLSSSVTTAPAVATRHSSITTPDLSEGVFPLTGVSSRSERLLQLRTTSLDNYLIDDEETRIHALTPLQVVYEGGTGLIFNRPTPANVVRKCVYMYEDKYSFCRVLQPGMLLFDSHFECGNLNSAYLVTSNRDSERSMVAQSHAFYDLYMNEDVTNATAGAQWFYFSVSGNRAKQKVTFSIRNFYKPESLFNEGMRPLVLSLKGITAKNGEKRKGWTRAGYNISYRQETQEEFTYSPAPPSSGGGSNGKRSNAKKTTPRGLKSILTFTHVFDEAQDTTFFAFCHPYSYSDLQTYLFFAEKKMEQSVVAANLSPRSLSPRYSKVSATKESSAATIIQSDPSLLFYYRTKLCDTLAGNRCDLLVISSLENIQLKKDDPGIGTSVSSASTTTSPVACTGSGPVTTDFTPHQPSPPLSRSSSTSSRRPSPSPSTRSLKTIDLDYYPIPGLVTSSSSSGVPHIIISARVHPGETTASWSMQGFLDFILSSHLKAQELRSKFIFLIIPMLNPDGVINGNNRTSLSGHDLNRNWRCPDAKRHPTIYHLKEMTQNFVNKTPHDILMYIDLHGHSRQKGAFTYGCLPDKNDIQQIREFFSVAASSNSSVSTRSTVGAQSTASLAAQNSSKNMSCGVNNTQPLASDGNVVTSVENIKTNNKNTNTTHSFQCQTNEIQAAVHHVGTRGILNRGRRRSEDSVLSTFLMADSHIASEGGDSINNEGQSLHHSPRKVGQLCTTDSEEHIHGDMKTEKSTVTSTKSFAPVLLRPSSPIVNNRMKEEKNSVGLEDANFSMNIDVNFDGYANNKSKSALEYSNRGASLETESDKTVPTAFPCGPTELESRFGSKEERVKSLPRTFLKKMASFTQSNCSYRVPTAKLSTSRAVMALEVGIECSYTLEISLAGDNKKLFQPTDLLNIGKAMGKSLYEWMQPALAYLETKRILEEQERVRQEQLEAYYAYNSRNKDRESRASSRGTGYGSSKNSSRPQSGSAIRSRPSSSAPRTGVKLTSNVLMMSDLDSLLYGPGMKVHSKDEKPPLPLPLALDGHTVNESGGKDHRHKQKSTTERPPRDGSTVTITKEIEKVQFAGQNQRKDNPQTKSGATITHEHHSKALTPSLQVRHPLPEYIFDGTEKGDLLASPVHAGGVQHGYTKKSSSATAKEKVPKLNLSIGPMVSSQTSAQQGSRSNICGNGSSRSSNSNNGGAGHHSSRGRKKENSSKQPLYSPRRAGANSEEAAWDEQLLKQQQSSPSSKSPRASVLKDSLQYAQSSRSGEADAAHRVVYQQQKYKNSPKLRSESAKARKSPKMSSSKINEVDWNERDVQAASSYMATKVRVTRTKSASHQRPSRDIIYSNQQQVPDKGRSIQHFEHKTVAAAADDNFSYNAKSIMAEHNSNELDPLVKNNRKQKFELADQLDQLRREYEESSRQLDDDGHADTELNLQSKDAQEIYQESAFSNYNTQYDARAKNIKSNDNRKRQQQLSSTKGVLRPEKHGPASFSIRIDGKNKP